MSSFVDRVAIEASSVRPLRVLLTVLALPFYVLGWVLGIAWVVVKFAVAAVKLGIAEAQARAARNAPGDAESGGG